MIKSQHNRNQLQINPLGLIMVTKSIIRIIDTSFSLLDLEEITDFRKDNLKSIIIIGLLIFGSISLNAQEEKIIKSEAKHYCQCYKSFNKKKKKLEKKTKRKEKRDSKSKKYEPGMKIFGGHSLDFNFGDCLNKKRSKNTADYIESLDDKKKERFRRKVKSLIKKKCSKHNSDYY